MSTSAQPAEYPQTGPITAEGKARSSQNAITHSIFARIETLPPELQAQYQAARQKIIAIFQPQTPEQLVVVESMGVLQWRIERCASYELDAEIFCNGDLNQLSTILTRLATYQSRLERMQEKAMTLYYELTTQGITTIRHATQQLIDLFPIQPEMPASAYPGNPAPAVPANTMILQPTDRDRQAARLPTHQTPHHPTKPHGLIDRFRHQFDGGPSGSQ